MKVTFLALRDALSHAACAASHTDLISSCVRLIRPSFGFIDRGLPLVDFELMISFDPDRIGPFSRGCQLVATALNLALSESPLNPLVC